MKTHRRRSARWRQPASAKKGSKRSAESAAREELLPQEHAVPAMFQQALALQREGMLREAAELYEGIIATAPGAGAAYCNLGHLYLSLRERTLAYEASKRATELLPESAEARANLGRVLLELGELDQAAEAFDRTLRLRPEWPAAINNAGTLELERGRLAEALALYEKALALDPSFADPRLNRGIIKLLQGKYAEGWPDYEARLSLSSAASPSWAGSVPRWQGEPLAGKTICLYAEQGLGDTIQFLRYLPMVQALGAEVILEAPSSLHRLIAAMPNPPCVIGPHERPPQCDWQSPLMSLPLVFQTRLETIPTQLPYLAPPPEESARAQALSWPGGRLRVGLVWAGTPDHTRDWARSVPFSMLRPLFDLDSLCFFSLQVGRAAEQLGEADDRVIALPLNPSDMADTAAKILELDLVISVDTAVAHLSGALGKPTWVLLPEVPDWRWLLDREDSPWYPSMRLFRQQRHGDWEEVIARVRDALHLWAGAHAKFGTSLTPRPARAERESTDQQGQDRAVPVKLRSIVEPTETSCKICKGASPLFGVVDFHKSCIEAQGKRLRLSGIPIYYRRCNECGLLFTEAFDDWADADFIEHIYNADYALVDPDSIGLRPENNALLIAQAFAETRDNITILDYGGGNGHLADLLHAQGFHAESYDPFFGHSGKPAKHFDLITCFEVLEHMSSPLETVTQMKALLRPGGLILFSTLLQPETILQTGLSWWYASPRNGHCSLYSSESLVRLFASVGLQVASASPALHMAYRDVPAFASRLRIGT